jgi:hypothetical protein
MHWKMFGVFTVGLSTLCSMISSLTLCICGTFLLYVSPNVYTLFLSSC